uniref:EF-hand domain-containing protein n=1 Tax=Chlamydomonas leiostraca TaxID=1034604 RepID=A0A7S0RDI4_9CHLO|mmetsp:Transcript_20167/g.51107  ORF Transcript_20167/g.51107 Transcript_20167/m.51107 type:complete len:170 (+) Transcript_20167:29-538(+)|eukprot:CAMPEP_0202869608 /NCGR_PEP_ID=MMETSP1391-20130828/12548_1 /ASSEMBLY_ACC=CAM_ASM_000867 /TAXON_ID=1034604 /ORGANISM="Chlamydomonas leiostraca, Strain SAG 11-49" /LENGTH=169 /DNA_ID=CAMNT_0049549945 /DNA_START=29 /DNA_END=538 /DNA_ORIENTATION=+
MAQPNPVQGWFQAIDTDRSGHLDGKEIQKALQMGGLNFELTDIDAMLRAFDTQGNRSLDLAEFTRLHEFLTSVSQSFQYFDQDRSGSLAGAEVHRALQHAGFQLDDAVVQVMMKKHDPDRSGSMSLPEFIKMTLFLQSCVRAFSAFDPQRRGKVEFTFPQFVYAASHVA